MICIRQYVPCHPSTNLQFTAICLLISFDVCLLPVTVTLSLLYEYLLKLKKNCPRPCPRLRPQEFGLDQHHWL